jgi:hypothetical protein
MRVPGMDDRDFNELLELLRDCGSVSPWVSIRQYHTFSRLDSTLLQDGEVRGSYLPRLLLAPLCMGLLCAAFPVDGISELPKSRSRPECTKRRGAPSSSTSSRPAHLAGPVIIPAFPERPQHEAAHDAPTPRQLGAQSQPGNQPQVFASVHVISPHGP